MFHLVIQTGKNKGRKIAISDREVTIGRDETCLVRLSSEDVSQRHCIIKSSSAGPLVRDLGSQSGTVVNDQVIKNEQLLRHGDVLQIGPVQFQVTFDKQPKSKPNIGEDDIASWLTESDTSGPKLSDTSLVRASDLRNNPWPEQRQKFDSLAEEAQDIIRRHRALKGHE